LLLCFTIPLQRWLASRLHGTGVEVFTASAFAKKVVDATAGDLSEADLRDAEGWSRVIQRAADFCSPDWDAIVVDEAQDLEFAAWVMLSSLAQGKRLWAFYDPSQAFWPIGLRPVNFSLSTSSSPGNFALRPA